MWWNSIEPLGKVKKHKFVFAVFYESFEVGNWIVHFLFRDESRTKFGIRTYRSLPRHDYLRKFASKVISEPELRKSLLSDNPELPEWWSRH